MFGCACEGWNNIHHLIHFCGLMFRSVEQSAVGALLSRVSLRLASTGPDFKVAKLIHCLKTPVSPADCVRGLLRPSVVVVSLGSAGQNGSLQSDHIATSRTHQANMGTEQTARARPEVHQKGTRGKLQTKTNCLQTRAATWLPADPAHFATHAERSPEGTYGESHCLTVPS